MKKILFIIILFLTLMILYLMPSHNRGNISEISPQDQAILLMGAEKIAQIWRTGDFHSLTLSQPICPNLPSPEIVGDLFYRCNIDWLLCLLEQNYNKRGNSFVVESEGREVGLRLEKVSTHAPYYYEPIARAKATMPYTASRGYNLKLSLQKKRDHTISLQLINNCHELPLPPSITAYGKLDNKKEDWKWDTLDSPLLIDRYLVTFFDLFEWADLAGRNLQIKKTDLSPSELYAPAFGITLKQMQEYCFFYGKELLTAEAYDAATFLPVESEHLSDAKRILRGPYPWSRLSKDVTIKTWQSDPAFGTTDDNCSKIYTQDCVSKFPFKLFSSSSLSYMGMGNLLGGYPEAVMNVRDAKENLKISSFYLPIGSSWHQLGARIFWDGEGFFEKNVEAKQPEELSELFATAKFPLKIGFRCMRYAK